MAESVQILLQLQSRQHRARRNTADNNKGSLNESEKEVGAFVSQGDNLPEININFSKILSYQKLKIYLKFKTSPYAEQLSTTR